jgi:hypothetical protein
MHFLLPAVQTSLVGGILLVAGIAKLAARDRGALAVSAAGITPALGRFVGPALASVEVVLGIALFTRLATISAITTLALFATFTAGLVVLAVKGHRAECHCFGQWASSRLSGEALVRSTALLIVAYDISTRQLASAHFAAHPGIIGRGRLDAATDVLSVLAIGVVLLSVVRAVVAAGRDDNRNSNGARGRRLGPLPSATLHDGIDWRVPLADRLYGPPLLLIFAATGCGTCEHVASGVQERLASKRSALALMIVVRGPLPEERQLSGIRVYGQRGTEVSRAFGVTLAPSAVLVADGQIIGDVAEGPTKIFELLDRAMTHS